MSLTASAERRALQGNSTRNHYVFGVEVQGAFCGNLCGFLKVASLVELTLSLARFT